MNTLWVQSEGLSCCTEVGPGGLTDKVVVQGRVGGYLQLQDSPMQW